MKEMIWLTEGPLFCEGRVSSGGGGGGGETAFTAAVPNDVSSSCGKTQG